MTNSAGGHHADDSHGRSPSAWLYLPEANQRWVLAARQERDLTIGRLPSNDVHLDYPRVSRRHAVLRSDGHAWIVVDNGLSSNGTYLNGRRVVSATRIHDGDTLTIGDVSLQFRQGATSYGVVQAQSIGESEASGRNARSSLATAIVVAGAIQVLGLVGNALGTYFSNLGNGWLRWAIPNVLAVVVAMIGGLITWAGEASPRTEQQTRQRQVRSGPSLGVILAVVLVLAGGGAAVTWGVRAVVGYVSGNEDGPNVLVSPVDGGNAKIGLTVNAVYYTSHFTRVDVTAVNRTQMPQSMPLYMDCQFIGTDGLALAADPSRSEWAIQIAPGVKQRGIIIFPGQLRSDIVSGTLTFTFPPSPRVDGIKLRPMASN